MRKIIQLCAVPAGKGLTKANAPAIFALCDDGTVWAKAISGSMSLWYPVEPIPQDEYETKKNNPNTD